MAKERTRIINLYITPGTISSIFKILKGDRSSYDFSTLSELRQLLSNEKAKILNTIKTQKPVSIYHLAKLLKRDFKSVRDDVILLQKMGILELKAEISGKRKRLKPLVSIDKLQINLSFQ